MLMCATIYIVIRSNKNKTKNVSSFHISFADACFFLPSVISLSSFPILTFVSNEGTVAAHKDDNGRKVYTHLYKYAPGVESTFIRGLFN